MSIFTFKGGIHPYDGKELSKDKDLVTIEATDEVVIPVSMHIGAPATPLVKVGDKVLKGQMIACASGFVSANIHSSVSGEVIKIEDRLQPAGNTCTSIVIKNDYNYDEVEYMPVEGELTPKKIKEKIAECGLVGMGGACFPTHVKYETEKDINYVIVNAAECEPYITADYKRMMLDADKIIEGLKLVLEIFPNAIGVIGIENNKKDAIKILNNLAKDEERITVAPLKTKYPQGSERQLIYAITKKKINSSMLPADAGCVVSNVETIYNVYRAVKLGIPVIDRIVTVSGDGINNPRNFLAPIGVSYKTLIEAAGGLKEGVEKVISGGPMMGFALFDLDVPVTKGSSSILAVLKDDVSHCTMTNCLNCGKCAMVCPENLLCAKIAQAADNDDMELFVKLYGMECIECGTCNYNCPANRNITQSVRTMKRKVIAKRREEAKNV